MEDILRIVREHAESCGVSDFEVFTGDEWAGRGENFGNTALVVIVHESIEAKRAFAFDGGDPLAYSRFDDSLHDAGCFVEQCTGWYSGVYPVGC